MSKRRELKLPEYYRPEVKAELRELYRKYKDSHGLEKHGLKVFHHPQFALIVQALAANKTPKSIERLIDTKSCYITDRTISSFRDNIFPYVWDIVSDEDRMENLIALPKVLDSEQENILDFLATSIRQLQEERDLRQKLQRRLLDTPKVDKHGMPIPNTTQFSASLDQSILELLRQEKTMRQDVSVLLGGQDIIRTLRAIVTKVMQVLLERSVVYLGEEISQKYITTIAKVLERNADYAIRRALTLNTGEDVVEAEEIEFVELGTGSEPSPDGS